MLPNNQPRDLQQGQTESTTSGPRIGGYFLFFELLFTLVVHLNHTQFSFRSTLAPITRQSCGRGLTVFTVNRLSWLSWSEASQDHLCSVWFTLSRSKAVSSVHMRASTDPRALLWVRNSPGVKTPSGAGSQKRPNKEGWIAGGRTTLRSG